MNINGKMKKFKKIDKNVLSIINKKVKDIFKTFLRKNIITKNLC